MGGKEKMMKKKLASLLCMSLAVGLLAAGCGSSGEESGGDKGEKEKPKVTLMIEIGGFPGLELAVDMAQEKFPDYEIISKEWSIDGVKKAIKTTQAAGGDESIDIAFFSSTGISSFAENGMLTNLQPYLDEDAEWAGIFEESMLSSCTFENEVYGIPWQGAYPVLVANEDIFAEAGIEIRDDWTYDELLEVCETLKEKGYYGLGVASGYNAWLVRQSYLNGFENEEDLAAFNRGEIPVTDEKVKAAFDRVKGLYDNNYCYPGEGAIAATDDEIKVGVSNGKVALAATTNSGAASMIEECGIENARVVNFPTISNSSSQNLLGAPDVYIVPSNAKNPEAVKDVLKYLTSEEVLNAMANVGVVVPLKEVDVEDPNYTEYSKDFGRLHSEDFANLSDEIGDYISTGTAMTNYLYDGESALDELEQLRKTAVGE